MISRNAAFFCICLLMLLISCAEEREYILKYDDQVESESLHINEGYILELDYKDLEQTIMQTFPLDQFSGEKVSICINKYKTDNNDDYIIPGYRIQDTDYDTSILLRKIVAFVSNKIILNDGNKTRSITKYNKSSNYSEISIKYSWVKSNSESFLLKENFNDEDYNCYMNILIKKKS